MIRKGKFKKHLIDEESLSAESEVLFERLQSGLKLHQENKITDQELVAFYILSYLNYRRPQDWLGGELPNYFSDFTFDNLKADLFLNPKQKVRCGLECGALDLFARYSMRAIPESVNRALVRWAENKWELILMTHIPTAEEVLEIQTKGQRVVTLLFKKDEINKFVLGERDPLGFVLHDLIHADHFFSRPEIMQGQIGFYKFVQHLTKADIFSEMMKDEKFIKALEYVISDMNAYSVHLCKYLKAILLGYFLRNENRKESARLSDEGQIAYHKFWIELLNVFKITPAQFNGLKIVNTEEYVESIHGLVIDDFFKSYSISQ